MQRLMILMAITALVACGGDRGEEPEPVTELEFEAVVGDRPFFCTGDYDGVGATEQTVAITDLRLYVQDIEVIDADGDSRSVDFVDDSRWQKTDVALLDFTDGSGHCRNTPEESNHTLKVADRLDDVESLRFTIGVPFELNHRDVATASSPLNLPAMFWNWNAGYKFVRIDTETDGGVSFRFHLGSTRCLPDADGGVQSCDHPNRPRVKIDDFDVDADRIQLDLDALFAGTDLSRVTDQTPHGCMATVDDPDCQALFDVLGLGDGSDKVDSSVFRPVPKQER